MVGPNRIAQHPDSISVPADTNAVGLGQNKIETFLKTVGLFVSKHADILL
jgi:hypothetical protein